MKTCQADTCTYPVFGKGFCGNHQWMREDKKPVAKKRKQIHRVSKNLAKARAIYSVLRIDFLNQPENFFCAVFPHLPATEVHHMDGRENWRLNNVDRWLPVSRKGHNWIDEFPELARERGFCGSRINLIKRINEE